MGTGLAYTVGFDRVASVLQEPAWAYVVPLLVALLISFVGYFYAYRGIYRIEGGPDLPGSQMRAVVTAGFGGFLAHGGSALDAYALQAAGTGERDAKVRVTCLGGMEHGMLSLIGTAAAIAVLAADYPKPPLDFTLPWAVPVPGLPSGWPNATGIGSGTPPDGLGRSVSFAMPSTWCASPFVIPCAGRGSCSG